MSAVTEQELAQASVAPRVTAADIDANIISEHYFTPATADCMVLAGPGKLPHGLSPEETKPASLRTLTFCVLVLRNGFTVVGTSACASPENFNADIWRIARESAVRQMWPLMGYELKERLYRRTQHAQSPEPSALELGAAARAAGPEASYED